MHTISRVVIALILGVVFFSVGPIRAMSASPTQAQINAVISLLKSFNIDLATITNVEVALNGVAIQTVSSTTTPSSDSEDCLILSFNLRLGSTDASTEGQVTKLQKYLANKPDIYPSGRVTGYFGPATLAAVQRWQSLYGIASPGASFGYVGQKTRAALACSPTVKRTIKEVVPTSSMIEATSSPVVATSTATTSAPALSAQSTNVSTTTASSAGNSSGAGASGATSASSVAPSSSSSSSTATPASSSVTSGSSSSSSTATPASSSSSATSASTASSTPTDTSAPSVTITNPASGGVVSGVVTLTATASDAVGVAGVKFKYDKENLGEDTSAPYELNFDTTSRLNGAHQLEAVARDVAGNETTASATFTINNEAPMADWGIAGVSGMSGHVAVGSPLSFVISAYNYREGSVAPATTLKAYFTPWYPNDGPQYGETGPRYGEQLIAVSSAAYRVSVPVSWSGTATPAGHYYFVVRIDPDNSVSETNESNNGQRSEFYID